MNCEILFRGKRLDNGEWVEGFYVHLYDRKGHESHRIYTGYAETDCGNFYPAWFEVDPDTVGRYTGLTDKNGVKIFEGDIIKTKKYGKIVGHTNVNDFDIFEVVYIPCRFRLTKKNREFDLADDGYSKFEIIGNIHDNPEILKEAQS